MTRELHVLVVDPNPEERKAMARVLRTAGHSVAEAATVYEAITADRLVGQGLILVDSGAGALAELAQLSALCQGGDTSAGAGSLVILTSGHIDVVKAELEHAGLTVPVIEKPFSVEGILLAVAAATTGD